MANGWVVGSHSESMAASNEANADGLGLVYGLRANELVGSVNASKM